MSTIAPEAPTRDPLEDIPTITREEILLAAAELILRRGWRPGTEGMCHDGPYCILGAVAAVMDYRGLEVYSCPVGMTGRPRFGNREPAALIGVNHAEAYSWNDGDFAQTGRGLFRPSQEERMASVLRRLAAGESWDEVTASA